MKRIIRSAVTFTTAAVVTAGLFGLSESRPVAATPASANGAVVEQAAPAGPSSSALPTADDLIVRYRTIEIEGIDVFYREAGRPGNPVVLLLHGFPTSSHMFRNLIPSLADRYHVIAPDYPGFGQSGMPSREKFAYTFDNFADVIQRLLGKIGARQYSLYVMDYGAPVGYRLFEREPQRVQALIVQNGNAYDEGLAEFWDPIRAYWADPTERNRNALRGLLTIEATKWQYTHGVTDSNRLSPDSWVHDQALLDRPGNNEIQLDLFYDYRTNVPKYPTWQKLFREHQPPTLIVWGKNDKIFPGKGATPYLRDLPNAESHLLDAGHFVLESHGPEASRLIRDFLDRKVKASVR